MFCARPSAAEFSSYAVLQDDASLVIRNKVVRLFGIYIPDPGQFCDTPTTAASAPPPAIREQCPLKSESG